MLSGRHTSDTLYLIRTLHFFLCRHCTRLPRVNERRDISNILPKHARETLLTFVFQHPPTGQAGQPRKATRLCLLMEYL